MYLPSLVIVCILSCLQLRRVRNEDVIIPNQSCNPSTVMQAYALINGILRVCFFDSQFTYHACNPNLGNNEASVICRELSQCKADPGSDQDCARATGQMVALDSNEIIRFPLRKKCTGGEAKLADCEDVESVMCPIDKMDVFFNITCPGTGGGGVFGPTAIWDDWSPWSSCSKTCGTGIRKRMRTCSDQEGQSRCVGESEESEECNVKACPVDGHWSNYGPYGKCKRRRFRRCFREGGCVGSMVDIEDCPEGAFNCDCFQGEKQCSLCEPTGDKAACEPIDVQPAISAMMTS